MKTIGITSNDNRLVEMNREEYKALLSLEPNPSFDFGAGGDFSGDDLSPLLNALRYCLNSIEILESHAAALRKLLDGN